MQEEAENALKEARKEAQAKVQAAKEATQAEQGKKLAEAKEVSTTCQAVINVTCSLAESPTWCANGAASMPSWTARWQRPMVTSHA